MTFIESELSAFLLYSISGHMYKYKHSNAQSNTRYIHWRLSRKKIPNKDDRNKTLNLIDKHIKSNQTHLFCSCVCVCRCMCNLSQVFRCCCFGWVYVILWWMEIIDVWLLLLLAVVSHGFFMWVPSVLIITFRGLQQAHWNGQSSCNINLKTIWGRSPFLFCANSTYTTLDLSNYRTLH